jgi:hypothetical protein
MPGHVAEELAALSRESSSASAGDFAWPLSIISGFHIRFESIHPLRDGNGRIGRILMAVQCQTLYDMEVSELLTDLGTWSQDYNYVFSTQNLQFRYSLLVDLLCRLMGVVAPPELPEAPPIALMPQFPDDTPISVDELLECQLKTSLY